MTRSKLTNIDINICFFSAKKAFHNHFSGASFAILNEQDKQQHTLKHCTGCYEHHKLYSYLLSGNIKSTATTPTNSTISASTPRTPMITTPTPALASTPITEPTPTPSSTSITSITPLRNVNDVPKYLKRKIIKLHRDEQMTESREAEFTALQSEASFSYRAWDRCRMRQYSKYVPHKTKSHTAKIDSYNFDSIKLFEQLDKQSPIKNWSALAREVGLKNRNLVQPTNGGQVS